MSEQSILDLEHATIRPLGEFPGHCPLCREVAETRKLQAACSHPENARREIDITAMGAGGTRKLSHCARCGVSLS